MTGDCSEKCEYENVFRLIRNSVHFFRLDQTATIMMIVLIAFLIAAQQTVKQTMKHDIILF